MDAIQQMFADNMKKMGLDVAASDPVAPVQPARRTVAPPTAPVQPVEPETLKSVPLPPVDAKKLHQSTEFQLASLNNVCAQLHQRVWALEKALRPALADKPMSEIDRIAVEYASLEGKTTLTYHEFRCLKRTARKALLREAAR